MKSSIKPIQYQKGWVEFYKLKFKVTPDVLIPRPETELLVEAVIQAKPASILDIGTGSGCIAVSLSKNIPGAKITATDISEKALAVAKKNAKLHGVETRIEFIQADLLMSIYELPPADIIATNLPYIPTERIPTLDPSVKDFEPKIALDGGEDGFDLYRKLFVQMIKKNYYPQSLIAEIDDTHVSIAVKEATKYFPKSEAKIKKDLAGKHRFLIITF